MGDPVTRLLRIDAFRQRLANMHARVGLVFFMPATRERFRNRLYRKWQSLGQDRTMLMATILASPDLKAEFNRRQPRLRAPDKKRDRER